MKLSPKQKKWGKRLLIFLVIRIILGAIFFYIVDYRFKDLIKLAVKDKSNHAYAFDSGDIEVSIFKKNVVINNAVLYATDTLNTKGHYKVQLKEVYFAMSSWKELIFHQRLMVDSIAVNSPLIFLHEHKKSAFDTKSPHIINLDGLLHRLLKHLRIKSFNINNASYVFKSKLHPSRLSIRKINFSLRNFTDSGSKGRLFNSEEINLKIGKQQINLPDGIHSMAFSQLQFSGRKKYFQLDSFSFLAKAIPGRAATRISAAELQLKSAEISEIFTKDALTIDTLVLFNPVVSVGASSSQSSPVNSNKMKHLFREVHFKFIKVEKGGFAKQATTASAPGYGSGNVDLRIYNLRFMPARQNSLQIDSIKLDLNKLSFKSKDGKTQLSVEEMSFHNNTITFHNSVYGPTNIKSKNGLTFTTPSLRLQNVSFAALINKRIVADQADLINPVINIKIQTKPNIQNSNKGDFSSLFKMFHSIKALITVNQFNIKDGKLKLQSIKKNGLNVDVEKLNASILADKMLNSDTTLQIKHAIPKLSFKRMKVSAPKLKLNLNDYFFYGKVRHNQASHLLIKIAGGPTIKAENLYWEWLDWDLYQSYRMVFIDSMRIGQLDYLLNSTSISKKAKQALPKIHLGRVDIERINVDINTPKIKTNFHGADFFAFGINTKPDKLQWLDLGGKIDQFHLNNNKLKLSIARMNIHAKGNNHMEELSLVLGNNENVAFNLPLIEFKGSFSSSALINPTLKYLLLQDPEIYFRTKQKSAAISLKNLLMPFDFEVQKIAIKNGTIYNQMLTDSLTPVPISRFDFSMNGLRGYKNAQKLLSIRSINADLQSLDFSNKSFNLSGPISLSFKNFEAIKIDSTVKLSSSLSAKSNNLSFRQVKDSRTFIVKNLGLSFYDPQFVMELGQRLQWKQLLSKTTIQNGIVDYQNAESRLSINSLYWLPEKNRLKLKEIDYQPKISIDEFKVRKPWQTDYIQATARTLIVEGIDLPAFEKQNVLNLVNITLDSGKIISSRDKRMSEQKFKEKLMPSKLIATLKIPISIQQVQVRNTEVNVNEISTTTGKEGTIILNNVNADLLNITNQPVLNDSLKLIGRAQLFGETNINLNYRESYLDSLSSFKMALNLSPMDLREINQVSIPLAAVKINSGNTDGVKAYWTGNKFYASGGIFMPYKSLSINMLNRENFERKGFLLAAENALINLIIHKKNTKQSYMFFERNRNKFVFNYWIKTLLTGFASSVGFKNKNRLKKQSETYNLKYHYSHN